MAKLILVVGLTGAGKSTYCHQLAVKEKAMVFSIDQWMKSLFWQDMPKEPDMKWFQENSAWYMERIERCEKFIAEETKSLLSRDVSVILDLGFTAKSHRLQYLELGRSIGSETEIHFLDVPEDERWRRVQKRNEQKGSTFSMHVSREMFDYINEIFETIDPTEKKLCQRFVEVKS